MCRDYVDISVAVVSPKVQAEGGHTDHTTLYTSDELLD